MYEFQWQPLTFQLRNPFRVAHGTSQTRHGWWLRLSGDCGWGEGTIPPYYGISNEEMIAFWQMMAKRRSPFPETVAEIAEWVGGNGPAPARCALDLALHDRLARMQGVSLYELLGLPKPPPQPTAVTIGIDSPAAMAQMARQMTSYPVLKLKLGSENDEIRVAAVRAVRPDVRLWVDANAAWSPEEAVSRLKPLLGYGLELVEQPVPPTDVRGMGFVQSQLDVPVVADESVQTLADVEKLAAVGVQGINVKLMKVGGVAPALAIIHRARELGLRVMLGCMVESSLGVTAMAHLAGLADWLDLDAPLLLVNDPFVGVTYSDTAVLQLPQRPGIGVVLRESLGVTDA
ncbi:MAG: dipeptide epimerase [Chloroflexi bacterium]|nr:MAG: dipeptide epimerase [Chloroflexota bacterium]